MTETTSTMPSATAPEPAPDAADAKAAPLRWRLAHRPDVRFGHAAGGVAGILAAAAVVAFVVAVTESDARLPGVGFNLALIAVALATGFFLRGPVRSAGVAAIAIAVPQVWFFAIAGDGGALGRGDYRIILALSVAGYLLFYLLTWTRGRAIFLGLVLFFGASWIVFEATSANTPLAIDAASEAQSGSTNEAGNVLGGNGKTTETAIVDLTIAAALLGTAVVLDRRRRPGMATPFLLVGGVYAVNAALTFGVDAKNVYATGAFVAVAGVAIGLAGSLGRRRGTSWIGAIVLLAGVVTVIAQATGDVASSGDNAGVFGGFALAGAAVLLLAGILVSHGLHEPVDGGEPFTPHAPRPPAPDPALVGAPAEAAPDVTPGPAAAVAAPIAWGTAAEPRPAAPPESAESATGTALTIDQWYDSTNPGSTSAAAPDPAPETPPEAGSPPAESTTDRPASGDGAPPAG
jgi:hypothetical protein